MEECTCKQIFNTSAQYYEIDRTHPGTVFCPVHSGYEKQLAAIEAEQEADIAAGRRPKRYIFNTSSGIFEGSN